MLDLMIFDVHTSLVHTAMKVDALQNLLHSLQSCIEAGRAAWLTAIAVYVTAA